MTTHATTLPPSPWEVDDFGTITDADGRDIADVSVWLGPSGGIYDWPTIRAVARLFVAAPALQDRIADAVELLDTALRGGADFIGRSQVMEAQSVLREALRLASQEGGS